MRTIVSVRSCDAGLQGPENLILTLAEALGARGIRFIIVCLWDGAPPAVALHEEAVRRGLESHVLRQAWGTDPSVVPRLRALIRRFRPDVVYTHDPKSQIVSFGASRLTGTPLIGAYYGRLTMRSVWLKAHDLSTFLVLRFFDYVLANSEAQRQELRRWRFPERRVEVLPSFVDTRCIRPPSPADALAAREALGIAHGRPVVATVARLSPNKGHTYMLSALPAIREQFPDVLYLVPGEGDAAWRGEGGFRRHLESQVAALGIEGHVRFLGYYPDVGAVLRAADLLVSPSLREGMQVSLLEAMAAARPIVATAIGGTPDAVVHGVTGLLVPPADSAALAAAVGELLADGDRRWRMGEAARLRAEQRFDTRVVADQFLQACERVCAPAHPGSGAGTGVDAGAREVVP